MTAAASLSSAFITDAIADFKGRLDALMEESLTKYRDLTVAGLEDEYTDGYGMITSLKTARYEITHPISLFKKGGVWMVHCWFYSGMGIAIDNYGNFYNYHDNVPNYMYPPPGLGKDYDSYGFPYVAPLPGSDKCQYPLTNKMIDLVKTTSAAATYEGINTLLISLKLVAESAYKSRQATLHLQRELAAEKAKAAALEAEIRRLKATAPPTEDLLGLNVTELAPLPTLNVVEVCPT